MVAVQTPVNLPKPDEVSPTPVPSLTSVVNFDDWVECLRSNFRHNDLTTFLTPECDVAPSPSESQGYVLERWNKRRRMARRILRKSTKAILPQLHAMGLHKNSSAVHIFDGIVTVMVQQAEETGFLAQTIEKLTHIDASKFNTLAAYQRELVRLRRILGNLNYCPKDRFLIYVAINGLREKSPKWARNLHAKVAKGELDWDGLMHAIYKKALMEPVGSTRKAYEQSDGEEEM